MNKFHLLDPTDKNHRAGKAGLQARAIPGALHDHHAGVQDYVLEPGLKVAVNTALALGSPLLLTGEPGTGKTHLAWYLNWYFGLHSTVREEKREEPYRFYTRSSSSARDLLWSFDTVRYFHDANIRRDQPVKLDKKDYREKGPLWLAIEQVNGGEPAVLLIDEIDKAPRDFPNDLLHELDQYHIRCTDTGEELRLKYPERPPILILTSNSERRLPEPFLRRCVVHHIALSREVIEAACKKKAETMGWKPNVWAAAVERWWQLRDSHGEQLRHKPGPAELFAWITALHAAGLHPDAPQLPLPGVLLKDHLDRELVGV